MSYNNNRRPRGRDILGPVPSLLSFDFANDLPGGRQYTNFESKQLQREKAQNMKKKVANKWEQVVDPPKDVKTFALTIDPSKVFYFSGRNNWMSNFYKAPVNIEGHVYPSVEHYYHACKLYMLAGAQTSNQIRRIPDAGQTKQVARRLLQQVCTNEQIEEWKMMHGPMILQHALIHKFVQHADLRKKLLGLGDQLLVHAYEGDRVYGAGMNQQAFEKWATDNKDKTFQVPLVTAGESLQYFPMLGNGKNVLGFLLMRVRDDIRKFQSQVSTVDPLEASSTAQMLSAAMSTLELNSTVELTQSDDEQEKKDKDSASASQESPAPKISILKKGKKNSALAAAAVSDKEP